MRYSKFYRKATHHIETEMAGTQNCYINAMAQAVQELGSNQTDLCLSYK